MGRDCATASQAMAPTSPSTAKITSLWLSPGPSRVLRRLTTAWSSQIRRSPRSLVAFSYPTLPGDETKPSSFKKLDLSSSPSAH